MEKNQKIKLISAIAAIILLILISYFIIIQIEENKTNIGHNKTQNNYNNNTKEKLENESVKKISNKEKEFFSKSSQISQNSDPEEFEIKTNENFQI